MFGFDWLSGEVLGAGLGAIAGASSDGESKSESKTLDPRIGRYVYGEDGNSGLLGDAASIYKQQMSTGGLNPMQTQGLNMRAQYLNSPQYKQTFDQMQQLGTGLLSAPIAGNPFTRGLTGAPPVANTYAFNPNQQSIQPVRPQVEQPQTQPGQVNSQPGRTQSGGGNGQRETNGSMGSFGGQGISNDVASAALQAMSLSENPAIRALFPTVAALLGVGGSAVAGQQADAMGAAGNKLAASQPLANLGIGTVSDMDGNVRTISTPSMIAAADRATFGNDSGQGGRGYGNMGNGGYGGATGGFQGSFGSGSVGGFR